MLSHRIASLRHLCSLGLPGEVFIPHFLDAVQEIVPSDLYHFLWTDQAGVPCNYYGNLTGDRRQSLFHFLENIGQIEFFRLEGNSLTFPEIVLGANEPVLIGQGEDRRRFHNSFLYNEVMRPFANEAEYVLLAPVRDAGRVRGAIGMSRSKGTEYSSREKAKLQGLNRYLCYALDAPSTEALDHPMEEDENRGVVLLERDGRIAQMDRQAERLLSLAAWPQDGTPLRRHAEDFFRPVREMCRNLVNLFEGQPSQPPHLYHRNLWGGFNFRAHWLQRPAGSGGGLVAVVISRHVPRKLRFWQSIHALGLPPRQQEVCMLFAERHSLTQIAERLNISRHTVIDHVSKIYERLDIKPDREALVERLLGGSLEQANKSGSL